MLEKEVKCNREDYKKTTSKKTTATHILLMLWYVHIVEYLSSHLLH